MYENVIEAIIITGTFKGQEVYIPKITMTTSNYQFKFRRLKFPVRLFFDIHQQITRADIKSCGIRLIY